MIRNNLIASFRALRRQGGYATINVLGLALGLASAVVVGLYIHDELSYDRFHTHVDRIARVELELQQGDHTFSVPLFGPAGEVAERDAAVESLVRLYRQPRTVVRRDDIRAYEEGLVYGPPELFEVFSFPLERGDEATALARPNTVVLTPEAARTYFGDGDPMGKTLHVGEVGAFEVTGVLRPTPANSTIRFTMIAATESRPARPMSEVNYVLLTDGASTSELAERLFPQIAARLPEMPLAAVNVDPLAEIHLSSLSPVRSRDLAGNVRYLYLFGGVGLLILLLAAINFVNLATATALTRAREVGVRKTLGARRGELVRQYLTEAGLQTAAAFGVGVALVSVALPAFNDLVGKGITLGALPPAMMVGGAVVLWGITTLMAGAYPAFVLSGYRPAQVLKGGPAGEGRGGGWLRRGLVVFQFAATIALLVGLVTIDRQMDHLMNQHLALAADQVLVLDPHAAAPGDYQAFKDALLALPGTAGVTVGYFPSGVGMVVVAGDDGDQRPINHLHIDADFLDVLGIDLVAGRRLDDERPADLRGAVLINEAAILALGMPDNPLGERLMRMTADLNLVESEVVGVVEDYPYASLKTAIQPQIIALIGDPGAGARRGLEPPSILVRLDAGMVASALTEVAGVWQRFAPEHPFEYAFLDERFDSFYGAEARLQRLFTLFGALALALACLGLIGLASFTAERRTKEIGVRKVLGATAASIVALLSRDFVILVAAAFAVGSPVAYWAMGRWLEDFAYRITLDPGIFLLAGGAALAIALLTVGYHAVRAATADPVKAIRAE